MNMQQRRNFLKALGMGGAGLLAPSLVRAAYRPEGVPVPTGAYGHVVVVGGGMGGAAVAKYLRLWGGGGVKVTLIEKNPSYVSNILSNSVLYGKKTLQQLTFTYANLAKNYGINVMQAEVTNIDPITQQVLLSTGAKVGYDRLVLSPGIQFDVIPGLEIAAAQTAVPHAWQAGVQTTNLRDQIKAMPAGGLFVLTIPAAPYRCPPGPYERACVVADYLKTYKPGSKVLVLDANAAITAEKNNFTKAFSSIHAGVIDYRPASTVLSIDATNRVLDTNWGLIKANVINAIPSQRAGKIVTSTGLNNATNGRFAGVNMLSYESTVSGAGGIHIIGDSSATTQPKAGHIANQEGKVCADAIVRSLVGQAPDPAPMTNSSCYTPITMSTASWLTAVYAYDAPSASMKVVGGAPTESTSINQDQYQEMEKWFANLMQETFS